MQNLNKIIFFTFIGGFLIFNIYIDYYILFYTYIFYKYM